MKLGSIKVEITTFETRLFLTEPKLQETKLTPIVFFGMSRWKFLYKRVFSISQQESNNDSYKI